jgi:quercetin dioxygenase-like cupin family protein
MVTTSVGETRAGITKSASNEMGMEADASETPRARAHHVTDPLIDVDLLSELQTLRSSEAYQASDHAAKVIAKSSGLRVVLIALKSGGRMDEHHADWSITVQGIDGHVEFTVRDTTIALTCGRLLAIAPGVPHSVSGIDESALLLTIGGAHAVET